jgi:hypothetical protein
MKSLEDIRRIKEAHEDELLKVSGVTGVDVGYKMVGGQPTDVLAIRVYVTRKIDPPPDQRIPSEIEGVPTDVIERRFELH